MAKIEDFSLERFMAFDQKTSLSFSQGINVFIGTNSTGKTLLMKALYSMIKVCEQAHLQQILNDPIRLKIMAADKFKGVFKPDHLGRLVRRSRGQANGVLEMKYDGEKISVTVSSRGGALNLEYSSLPDPTPAVFLPVHEFLSASEGFVHAYSNRELFFDETYYDLSLALSGALLRGPRLEEIKSLVEPLEKEIGGHVTRDGERFYIRLPEGKMEASIASEGYRKIAGLIYLINNGSLTQNGILFWDEPEANLNPKLVKVIVETLHKLAESGVQIFVTTHDYLVSQKLSLLAEYKRGTNMRFFAFQQARRGAGVNIEWGDTLAQIDHNPILDEFSAHYDEEINLFARPEG
ncbi:MAG: AAA family ATPase [Chloroflexota bacterium]